jgi:hypothetical protein
MQPNDSDEFSRPRSWRERHALTIMLVVMALLFALVIVVQVTR